MTEARSGALLRAFLIKGLAGGRPFYFYGGLDVLARKLAGEGVSTSVHPQGSFLRPYGEVGAITDAALAEARKGARPILIGHSMGADAALKVAVRLDAVGVAVPLVVCFDPTSFRLLFGAPPVPGNVARALCFYRRSVRSAAAFCARRPHSRARWSKSRSRPFTAMSMTIPPCMRASSPK
jgi:alpha-beta hydrolase superfamily lysophospholipase